MFAETKILYLGIIALIALIALFFISEKKIKQRRKILVATKLTRQLIPRFSQRRVIVKIAILSISVAFLFLGLARPQWGTDQRKSSPRGIDILIAVDVSKSMLARDVRPNRLERVKLALSNLIEKVKGDRLGLIGFAGSSFLHCPLTLDHQAFLKTIENFNVDLIKTPGTNLALAIDEASSSFAKEDNDRFLILISDGEDLEGEGMRRAKIAKNEGIKIFTIGIGSSDGSFIPTDPIGQEARNFLKDRNGKLVISRMDEDSLKKISEVTEGRYFKMGPTGEGLVKTFEILQKVGQQKQNTQLSTDLPIERFQPFIIIALIMLLLEFIVPSASKLKNEIFVIILLILLGGCLKQDNIKRAEDALEKGNPSLAAHYYSLEINSSENEEVSIDPKLHLNAGLAHLEANALDQAEFFLEKSLDSILEEPEIQSVALNALGNIFYRRANLWLDQQNVSEASKAWKKALEFYNSAYKVNGYDKALTNMESLGEQIEGRIKSLISTIYGKVWRDINGDGIIQENEPGLKGLVFWDKNNDGELNSSIEAQIPSNEMGDFQFEWITNEYPSQIAIGTKLVEMNQTQNTPLLIPLFPPPPPPVQQNFMRNHQVNIDKPGQFPLLIPYRAAPLIEGEVWIDLNGNGQKEENEKGSPSAKIFLDQNGNSKLDENETSFPVPENGKFQQYIPPGEHAVSISPENPDANVTFPLEQKKAYVARFDFEGKIQNLNFGIQDITNENNQSQESQGQDPNDANSSDEKQADANENMPNEVNALYERLLQETESKSEPLTQDDQRVRALNNGRDY